MSPVFYTFNDRERAFGIIEAICGARMHPNWFRIGGVAQDLPKGWDGHVSGFLEVLAAATDRVRQGSHAEPDLQGAHQRRRRTALRRRPSSGVSRVPICAPADSRGTSARSNRTPATSSSNSIFRPARHGDCYDRAVVRVEEMRQSLRIIEQCVDNMPGGPIQVGPSAGHARRSKERTMHDIETLITHFLGVSWGPVIPPGEALGAIEATKGNNGYYLVSDGGNGFVPDTDPHAIVRSHADAAAACAAAGWFPTCSPSWAPWTTCWRIWIDEKGEKHADG